MTRLTNAIMGYKMELGTCNCIIVTDEQESICIYKCDGQTSTYKEHCMQKCHLDGVTNAVHALLWASCQIRNIPGCACADRELFPRHRRFGIPTCIRARALRTCVTYVPWCMPGLLTCGLFLSQWRGKLSRHSRRMRNQQFYISGKRPMIWIDQNKQKRDALLYCYFESMMISIVQRRIVVSPVYWRYHSVALSHWHSAFRKAMNSFTHYWIMKTRRVESTPIFEVIMVIIR